MFEHHVCAMCPQKPEGVRSPRTRITDIVTCHVSVGNRIQVLYESPFINYFFNYKAKLIAQFASLASLRTGLQSFRTSILKRRA